MPRIVYTGQRGHIPSQAKIGLGVPDSVFAGENAIREPWGWRVFGGWGDQSETRPASSPAYTISLTANNPVGVCSGGATCKTDFRVGQHIVVNRRLFLIEAILADDQMRLSPTPDVSAATQTIYRVPVLSSLALDRATLHAGNATLFRNTAIFAVGEGSLYRNGAALAPALTATSNLKVAYPVAAGGFASHDAGFTTPAAPTVVEGTAGTKNLPTGNYWIAVARKREGFSGQGNPSARVQVTITVAGRRPKVSLGAFATSEGQSAWVVFVNRISERGQERPGLWRVAEYDVQSTDVEIDWFDDELKERATYDNDAPPKAGYVFSLGNYLAVASCGGAPDASGVETTPGPEIAASKYNNPEAFSPFARTPTALGEPILGVTVGELVAMLLTPNTLQVASLTGSDINPFAIRQEWNNGFAHQFSGCMAGDLFYGFTKKGFYRTLGKDTFAPDDTFAEAYRIELQQVVAARAFVGFDPASKQVVLFESNAQVGAGSGWQTKARSFNTESGYWNTPCILGDGTTDFTVTSCANINGELWFTTSDGKTYKWEAGAQTITGFLGFPFNVDDSAHQKTLRSAKLTGNANKKIKVYKDLDINGLRSGGSAPEFTLTAGGGGESVHHRVWLQSILCRSYAYRVEFELTNKAQILDALEVDYVQHEGFQK